MLPNRADCRGRTRSVAFVQKVLKAAILRFSMNGYFVKNVRFLFQRVGVPQLQRKSPSRPN